MRLELSTHEANLLSKQLGRRIAELDAELVRTDKHELQHALNLEIADLRLVDERLRALIASSGG